MNDNQPRHAKFFHDCYQSINKTACKHHEHPKNQKRMYGDFLTSATPSHQLLAKENRKKPHCLIKYTQHKSEL